MSEEPLHKDPLTATLGEAAGHAPSVQRAKYSALGIIDDGPKEEPKKPEPAKAQKKGKRRDKNHERGKGPSKKKGSSMNNPAEPTNGQPTQNPQPQPVAAPPPAARPMTPDEVIAQQVTAAAPALIESGVAVMKNAAAVSDSARKRAERGTLHRLGEYTGYTVVTAAVLVGVKFGFEAAKSVFGGDSDSE
jgi:hypothetical protein